MSAKRICKNCGGDVPPHKLSSAKFCKDSCRARFHEKKILKQLYGVEKLTTDLPELEKPQEVKPKPNLIAGLEGVAERKVQIGLPSPQSEAKPEVKNNAENGGQYGLYAQSEQKKEVAEAAALIPFTVKVETEHYKKVKRDLDKVNMEYDRAKAEIKSCDEQIATINRTKDFSLLPMTTTAAGGILAHTDKKILPTVAGAIGGWGIGKLIDTIFFEDNRKKEAEQTIVKIKNEKMEWQKLLEEVIKTKKMGENFIATIPRYETKTEMRPSPFFKLKLLKPFDNSDKPKLLPEILEGLKQNAESAENNNAPENMDAVPNEINEQATKKEEYPEVETNGRIISSKAFREMTYPALILQSRWNDFFGEPSTTFHCVVHGKPGEGKSTFCIQFAYYLAKHHGNTIYISGEEGFSKTLQQKVNMTNAEHPRLFFTDLKSFEEIKENIKDEFHFIFIDSLDTLSIDPKKVKELKALHPSSAFITISQSTKAGGARGSQEIIHDADIAVRVEKGFAVTEKNRFKEKDMRFGVFPEKKKQNQ